MLDGSWLMAQAHGSWPREVRGDAHGEWPEAGRALGDPKARKHASSILRDLT